MEQIFAGGLPSLLWPPGHDRVTGSQGLGDQQAVDLALDVVARALDPTGRHGRFVRGALMALVADPDVIRYRQATLNELRDSQTLRASLGRMLPLLAELAQPRSAAWAQESPLLLVPPRLSDLELYVGCVDELGAALAETELRSPGLRSLQAFVAATVADPEFAALRAELPELRHALDKVASVTVGLNLDRDLRPLSATLVALNREPFSGPRSLAERLFGKVAPPGLTGMTALRHVAERSPGTDPLAQDLEKLLAEVVQPVANGLERYQRIHARPLAALEPELALLLGAVAFAERLASAGLPTTLPAVSADSHLLQDAYNPALALQLIGRGAAADVVVPNPVDFDAGGIILLTGPNRGGKTTYLRTVGLNQVLFQAGLPIAATAATMAPVDAVLTHFPPAEDMEPGGGRLDNEARRLREIFGVATARSLVLFNEPLTSTSEREAHALAADILKALQLLGARTIFVTHLHSLSEETALLGTGEGRSRIVSWTAGVGEGAQRTYWIRPGQPALRSHAATIAEQHGITFAQLAATLAERGLAEDDPRGHTKTREEEMIRK